MEATLLNNVGPCISRIIFEGPENKSFQFETILCALLFKTTKCKKITLKTVTFLTTKGGLFK